MAETREERRMRRDQMMKESLSELHELDKEKIRNNIPIKDTYLGKEDPKVKLSPHLVNEIIEIAKNSSLSNSEVGNKIRILIQQREGY